MAGKSDLQSRRYFLQDETLQVATTASFAPVNLANAHTIRVQVIATAAAGDITVSIGGQTETINVAEDAAQGGTQSRTVYVDFRGTLCTSNEVSYTAAGGAENVASVYYNLLRNIQR